MAKNSVADWDATAANNTDVGGIDINEGCPSGNVNDAIREVMAQVKTYSGTVPALSSANTFTGVNTYTKIQKWAKGADVASASTLTLGDDGNYFDITGTTAITAIATKGAGTVVKLHFDASLTLTHHATDLILPGGANIVTAAGDEAEFVEYATGDWRCTSYQYSAFRANGGVVEAGSNANGRYTKFADGTMICWSSDLAFTNVSTATGSLFNSSPGTWTFPAAFDTSSIFPVVQANDTGATTIWSACRTTSGTSAEIRLFAAASVVAARTVRATAIGRWF